MLLRVSWQTAGRDGAQCHSTRRCGTILWVMKRKRLHIFYSGRVQGVGFRYTVKSVVSGFEVNGKVRNLPEGEQPELEEFRKAIQDSEVGGFIRNEEVNWADATGDWRGFEIRH
jgi:acylphosphatase